MKLRDPTLLRERCYSDGAWVAADDGATLPVHNPATGAALGVIPSLGAAETRRAIEAAAAALPAWAARTAKERASALRRWFEAIMAAQEDLAVLMTAEQGKPLAESKGEIAYAASFIEWFAEEGNSRSAWSPPSRRGISPRP
jgi:succinate-semialdehyde dehydrogenase/glutarate-semialdehyde dehydrogenase